MITVAIIKDNRLVREGMTTMLNVVAMSEMREVRALREENHRLSEIVANLLLEKHAASDGRKSSSASLRLPRALAYRARKRDDVSLTFLELAHLRSASCRPP